ncbi:MAG: PD-(D/E)XK nuclease family protein [Oscillospiraceae bacterium]|nr:PD-(D/E)XK nuclease family protein [Oscillospiraceae bacterium]
MLRLFLSPDHITLRDSILSQIFDRVSARKGGQLLIVPEQYSFDMERRLASGGAEVCLFAEVLSLSRLAGRVESLYGGTAQLWLDQGGRLLTADLAVDQAFPRLKFYASVCRKPEFLERFLSAVDEWEGYNITPSDLIRAAERFDGRFAQKLQELGLLYESYRTACGLAQDPILRLRNLCDTLEDVDYLADKDLYVYGFSDFTALEYEILEACISNARSVTLALPWEERNDGEPLFSETGRLRQSLAAFCERAELPIEVSELSVTRERPAGLAAVQDRAAEGKKDDPPSDDGSVRFTAYASVEQECRAAAAEIRSLMRTGVRCRDIAIACADLGTYGAILRNVLTLAEIPHYVSGKTSLADSGGAEIVLLALRAVTGGMEREAVLDYLKSGVTEESVCDRLEGYAYLWNVNGARWFEEWKKHPRGIGLSFEESDLAGLAALNADRKQAMQPLLQLKNALSNADCVGDMVRAVYGFMEAVSLRERLQTLSERFAESGELAYAQQYEQVFDLLLDALEQMYLVDGAQVKKADDFCALLERLFARFGIGTIPSTLDQVQIGDVAAFRGRSVSHLMILGASEGVFPAFGSEHGIFTEAERNSLLLSGMTLAPLRADRVERELSGVWQTIRSAERSLRISCSGDAPSSLLTKIAKPFGGLQLAEPMQQPLNTEEAAGEYLRAGLAEEAPETLRDEIMKLSPHLRESLGALSEQSVLSLYGREISLSPTKTDLLASCRFSYFLKYGLRAQEQRRAELDPAAFGTFVHDVMEKTVGAVRERGGFRALGEDAWRPIAEKAVSDYVTTALRDLGDDDRTKYFLDHAKREIMAVTEDLARELRGSAFEPQAEELKFGPGEAVPTVIAQGENATAALRGTVDRVDLFKSEAGDYLRVADYKTGKKVFDYAELEIGRGMQMLLYLFALKNSGLYGKEVRPAGVLYHPARFVFEDMKEDPTPEKLFEKLMEQHKRKGVVLNDPTVLAAMENDLSSPKYLPLKKDKNGELVGDLADAREMEALEKYVYQKLGAFADEVFSGDVTPNPYNPEDIGGACTYCAFSNVCQKDVLKIDPRKLKSVKNREFFAKIMPEEEEDG